MATRQTQLLARTLMTPAVALLFIWMIVPLALTIYFSTLHYNLLDPGSEQFVGLENFRYFLTATKRISFVSGSNTIFLSDASKVAELFIPSALVSVTPGKFPTITR